MIGNPLDCGPRKNTLYMPNFPEIPKMTGSTRDWHARDPIIAAQLNLVLSLELPMWKRVIPHFFDKHVHFTSFTSEISLAWFLGHNMGNYRKFTSGPQSQTVTLVMAWDSGPAESTSLNQIVRWWDKEKNATQGFSDPGNPIFNFKIPGPKVLELSAVFPGSVSANKIGFCSILAGFFFCPVIFFFRSTIEMKWVLRERTNIINNNPFI